MRLATWVIAFASFQASAPETCPPCGEAARAELETVKKGLTRAFELAMTTSDCTGVERLTTCRDMEGFLEEAFDGLRDVIAQGESNGSIDCLGCDPRPYVTPLLDSFDAVADLLVARGYEEFTGKLSRMRQDMELWRGYRCCDAPDRERPTRNREMDARALLEEKCGASFERNRKGLRQVVRMPGDRSGCYQSRACREATQYNGQHMEAGYWTYDGEYWYVWADRLTPRGTWTTCGS